MACHSFNELINHYGHDVEVVSYGPKDEPLNVAVECQTCHEILFDFDRYNEDQGD